MNRKVTSKMLVGLGHETVEAPDGVDAVHLIRNSLSTPSDKTDGVLAVQFDGVLMDNVMVTMHGPEAAKCMRQLGYDKPIIGITGNALPKDVEEFRELGANAVYFKPLRREHMIDILRMHFEH